MSVTFPKFRRDDIVEYRGCRCIIIKTLSPKDDENRYLLRNLVSNIEDSVWECDIKFYSSDLKINNKKMNYGTTCPRCGSPWKTSGFAGSKWYDCIKCNKKAEDICFMSEAPSYESEASLEELDLEYLMDLVNNGNFRP